MNKSRYEFEKSSINGIDHFTEKYEGAVYLVTNKMKKAIITLMFAVAGCGNADPLPASYVDQNPITASWIVSNDFTFSESVVISSAAIAWRSATFGEIALIIHNGEPKPGQWVITKAKRSVLPDIESNPNRITIGTDDYVGSECQDDKLWHIAAYQFGKTFGITENSGTGVMSTEVPVCKSSLAQSDVDLFYAAN